MENLLLLLKTGLIKLLSAGLALLGVAGLLSGDSSKTAGLATYYLSGSGVTSSATSLTLTSFTLPQNSYEIQDSDLSDTFYLTLEPGNKTRQEFVSCTTVAQSGSDTTATLSGCTRGLSPISPYTASSTLQFAHAGGTAVISSNPPQLYNDIVFKNNDETISGIHTFSSTSQPRLDVYVAPSSDVMFATKRYADDLAFQGVATATESVIGASRLTNNSLLGTGQASSTSGAPLTLLNRNTCNTFNSASSTCIVVTDSSNKIASNFIATSSANPYNFGGNITFNNPVNASSTLSVNSKLNVSTSTPSQGVSLAVNGGALISGTTTISNLVVASTTPFRASTTIITATSTWTVPNKITKVKVRLMGGGGGAGACGGSCTSVSDTGGGGGGGYAEAIVSVAGLTSVTVNIGIGGVGNTLAGDGNSGGNTSFAGNTTITAAGGSGSLGRDSAGGTAGGAGGGCTNADFCISGRVGQTSIGGAEAAEGGDSFMGFGARKLADSTTGNGNNGTTYGGGGGGADGTNNDGGNGANGVAIIEWIEGD